MATRGDEPDNTTQQNIDDEFLQDPDPHQKRVEIFFKPLEAKWDFIRDVLLWKKPVYSLCIFIVVNGIFRYIWTLSRDVVWSVRLTVSNFSILLFLVTLQAEIFVCS